MENLGANWESYPSQMRNRLLRLLIERVALGHDLADEGNLLRMLWPTATWGRHNWHPFPVGSNVSGRDS